MRNAIFVFVGGLLGSVIAGSDFFGLTCTGWMDLSCLVAAGLILLVTQSVAAVLFLRIFRTALRGTPAQHISLVLGGVSFLIAIGLLWIFVQVFVLRW